MSQVDHASDWVVDVGIIHYSLRGDSCDHCGHETCIHNRRTRDGMLQGDYLCERHGIMKSEGLDWSTRRLILKMIKTYQDSISNGTYPPSA